MSRNRRRGSAMVEFVLVGVTLLFAWISAVEMARGMWHYHTLQYAVKAAGGYVAVHGANCAVSPNSCTIEVKDVAAVLKKAAIGIPDNRMNVQFTSASGTRVACNPLNTCYGNTTQWPPATPTTDPDNLVGKSFTIRVDYVFNSALSMVTPGVPQGVVRFGAPTLSGFSQDTVLF
jgi:TadE-like protein